MAKLKKGILFILIGIVAFLGYHYESTFYGIQQGIGQAEVLWNAQPVEELLADSLFPDSIKAKFRYIEEVKKFAEEQLGLTKTENYTSYYDQEGKPILWVVTASPEFKIEAHQWRFPIAGSFPYKGFFDIEKAKKEQQKFEEQDFDTELGEVNAWSTLGWFKDPILSSMLNRSEGRLAELIIHESTHATLYVKDSAEFNENLASFTGKLGAEKFLAHHFGNDSDEFKEYRSSNERKKIYKDYMRLAIEDLRQKYEEMDSALSLEEKRKNKQAWLDTIKEGLFELNYFQDSVKARKRMNDFEYNNAYFSGFSTYSEELPKLRLQLEQEFKGDLSEMITSFKKKYKSL